MDVIVIEQGLLGNMLGTEKYKIKKSIAGVAESITLPHETLSQCGAVPMMMSIRCQVDDSAGMGVRWTRTRAERRSAGSRSFKGVFQSSVAVGPCDELHIIRTDEEACMDILP